MEHVGDKVKGTLDSAASTFHPNVSLARPFLLGRISLFIQSEKSTTQQMGDSASGNSNENQVHYP
jgi:hypothetical protein